ncbi:DNA repair protein RecO [Mobiluncus curtisii]|uniref:DNA repair protein RecO n=1 Tax=Mobiluncus curtisii TaxID=2051 RepID=UPI00242F8ED7|nr:DNA repair protein RecO [Mobiluncus curtisii]
MRTFRDAAVVLRTQDLGEADRIVTLLTEKHGLLRCVGRGVRKTTSRLGARLEPFGTVDIQIRWGKSNLHNIEQVEILAPYGRSLANDYARYTAANLMVETLERLTEDSWTNERYYHLTIGALHALATGRHEPSLILDSYLLRLMSLAGWAASCWDCASCGARGPHEYFNPSGGGAMCVNCKLTGARPVDSETMRLLAALATGDWQIAQDSGWKARAEAHALVSTFVQWHVERRLKSMSLLELA